MLIHQDTVRSIKELRLRNGCCGSWAGIVNDCLVERCGRWFRKIEEEVKSYMVGLRDSLSGHRIWLLQGDINNGLRASGGSMEKLTGRHIAVMAGKDAVIMPCHRSSYQVIR